MICPSGVPDAPPAHHGSAPHISLPTQPAANCQPTHTPGHRTDGTLGIQQPSLMLLSGKSIKSTPRSMWDTPIQLTFVASPFDSSAQPCMMLQRIALAFVCCVYSPVALHAASVVALRAGSGDPCWTVALGEFSPRRCQHGESLERPHVLEGRQ